MSAKKDLLHPLKNYLHTLIDNLDRESIPKKIDLIIDSGAFNGGYQYGILLYLRELETLKILTIDKISGCSVGALLGALYLINSLDKGIIIYDKFLESFRETNYLKNTEDIIRKIITNNIDDVTFLNDRLYITYYNIKTMKQITVSTYNTKEDLIDTLIKATYLPYITDSNLKYKDGYCDGFNPYIFPKTKKSILFISLLSVYRIKTIFYIKNEINIWSRLLNGVVDINNFFLDLPSDFCSYINNWTLKDFLQFRSREIFALATIFMLNQYIYIQNILPDSISKNIYITRLQDILVALYKNIFSHLIL